MQLLGLAVLVSAALPVALGQRILATAYSEPNFGGADQVLRSNLCNNLNDEMGGNVRSIYVEDGASCQLYLTRGCSDLGQNLPETTVFIANSRAAAARCKIN